MALPWKHFLAVSFLALALQANGENVQFEKTKIVLGKKTVLVEVAKSESQHEQGLMFRKKLGEDEGMLFVFPEEQIRNFWMKNTFIDLSIGYFDKGRVLIDMQEMRSTSVLQTRPPSYPSLKPAMYALEMNRGWFVKNRIKLGHKFEFSKR